MRLPSTPDAHLLVPISTLAQEGPGFLTHLYILVQNKDSVGMMAGAESRMAIAHHAGCLQQQQHQQQQRLHPAGRTLPPHPAA